MGKGFLPKVAPAKHLPRPAGASQTKIEGTDGAEKQRPDLKTVRDQNERGDSGSQKGKRKSL